MCKDMMCINWAEIFHCTDTILNLSCAKNYWIYFHTKDSRLLPQWSLMFLCSFPQVSEPPDHFIIFFRINKRNRKKNEKEISTMGFKLTKLLVSLKRLYLKTFMKWLGGSETWKKSEKKKNTNDSFFWVGSLSTLDWDRAFIDIHQINYNLLWFCLWNLRSFEISVVQRGRP